MARRTRMRIDDAFAHDFDRMLFECVDTRSRCAATSSFVIV